MEWISVKDRLPENGVHVLLCCEMHRHGGEIAGRTIARMMIKSTIVTLKHWTWQSPHSARLMVQTQRRV